MLERFHPKEPELFQCHVLDAIWLWGVNETSLHFAIAQEVRGPYHPRHILHRLGPGVA